MHIRMHALTFLHIRLYVCMYIHVSNSSLYNANSSPSYICINVPTEINYYICVYMYVNTQGLHAKTTGG